MKNYDEACRMYEAGLSIQEVANFYDLSRQAMHRILTRRGIKMRSRLKYGQENHFHRGGKNQHKRAGHILEKAIIKGLITRPIRCENCGGCPEFRDGRSGIQGHHKDYNKPLDVMWLCQTCHHEWHKTNKPIPLERR